MWLRLARNAADSSMIYHPLQVAHDSKRRLMYNYSLEHCRLGTGCEVTKSRYLGEECHVKPAIESTIVRTRTATLGG